MILYQSIYRTFDEFPCSDVQCICSFLHFFLKIPGDGTGEMHFTKRVVVLHDIPLEEIRKTRNQQCADSRFFSVG